MSAKFQPINRDTPYLLPPSLQDWLPEKHLARFVVDIVDQLDLSELVTRYGGGGKQPYHPAVLVALLFYGYATGIFSSRKLEQATHDSVAFRYITADAHPDHDTVATFRKRFLPELEGLFVQILVVAKVMGVFKLGKVSLDGTKIKANASKHKAMSWGYANKLEEQLRREVQALLRRAEQADTEDKPPIDIPDELARREDRLAAIKQARGREPKPPEPGPRDKDQVNFTDGESRIMPSSEGFVQGYNAQAAVDIESYLIVENHITQQPNDKQEIEPTLNGLADAEAQLGKAEALLADAGYFSADNVGRCEDAEIIPYISDHRERHNLPWDERFRTPPPCPPDADAVTAMAYRLRTAEGKAIYAKRKSTVETVFGIIKEVMGFRRFHLRGRDAAQGEWCGVHGVESEAHVRPGRLRA